MSSNEGLFTKRCQHKKSNCKLRHWDFVFLKVPVSLCPFMSTALTSFQFDNKKTRTERQQCIIGFVFSLDLVNKIAMKAATNIAVIEVQYNEQFNYFIHMLVYVVEFYQLQCSSIYRWLCVRGVLKREVVTLWGCNTHLSPRGLAHDLPHSLCYKLYINWT